MVKELYQIHNREITLNVTGGAIDSVRKKNIVKSGCRVYENGCIGVAGTLGGPTDDTWRAAQEALALGIACPQGPTANLVRTRERGQMPGEGELIAWAEHILATLKAEFPRFILSNKIKARETVTTLKNDAGLDLRERQCQIVVSLVVKDEQSANVFDTFIHHLSPALDTAAVLDAGRQVMAAHENCIPMPQAQLPVVLGVENLLGALYDALSAKNLSRGASLLSGKVGQKLFDGKLTMVIDRGEDSDVPFFDSEGTTLPGDRTALIEHGVLVRGLADKQCADEFGADLTASGAADYDDVPQLTWRGMDVVPTGTLEEILQGGDAIYISTASGGDTTPAGDFATPVQTAYLMHGGRLTARLPEFNFGGSIFDLLGSGYLGCPKEKPDSSRVLVLKGNIR
ncbi:MAG: metallopeptidase TldD-related protein [Eubacteriales bacterium]|nr:metallopeptidase TldD-related protein [Eubacteriales bacterium]